MLVIFGTKRVGKDTSSTTTMVVIEKIPPTHKTPKHNENYRNSHHTTSNCLSD